jgi:3',5'-cyclic AMP phosphodiesterase CpdA
MRRLIHLSDLHFGRIDSKLLDPLVRQVHEAKPHLVVVSGDLTQRAKSHQFREARAFLERLPRPQLVVPGNHDVPLWNVFMRFARPLARYRRYITADDGPFHSDEEIAVVGLNTARSLVIKGGRVNEEQLDALRQKFKSTGEHVTRVVATHHPFDLPSDQDKDDLAGRAKLAMQVFAECRTDLLLAGHMHEGDVDNTAERYHIEGYSAVVVHAGSATSTRTRGALNSFNLIDIEPSCIVVTRRDWDAGAGDFRDAEVDRFERRGEEWLRVA